MPQPSRFTPEQDDYIRHHYPTAPTKDIAQSLGCTERHVRDRAFVMGVKKLPGRKTLRPSVVFSPAADALLRERYPCCSNDELSVMLGIKTEAIAHRGRILGLKKTPETLRRIYSEAMLKTGKRAGQFQPGEAPWNKGINGYSITLGRSHYRPGNRPPTWVPVGTTRWSTPPLSLPNAPRYLRVKVAEPDVWKLAHRHLWEQHHGPIPAGHVVIFKDHNTSNIDIENLACVPRGDLSVSNSACLPIGLVPLFRTVRDLDKTINQKERATK